MGIPGFSLWFSKKNSDAYVPLNSIVVDHVYIDLNSVLHTVLRRGARGRRRTAAAAARGSARARWRMRAAAPRSASP
jgi:5'-3' exonuclease